MSVCACVCVCTYGYVLGGVGSYSYGGSEIWASWKLRKANGVVQSGSKGPRTRGTGGSLKAGEMRWCPSSNSEAEKKGESFSLLIFVLFRPSMDLLTPACTGEGNLPY